MRDLERQIAAGESESFELKRSTAQLGPAGQTLCAFLNAEGDRIAIGVADGGRILGRDVSDRTRHELASMLDRFEPHAPVEVEIVDVPPSDRKLILLDAPSDDEARPYLYDGRAYQRVQSTTSVMPQERYEAMLLERTHAPRRWETQAATEVTLYDLDHEAIPRTRGAAVRQRRISPDTRTDMGDILDRLGLGRGEAITLAAQMLYGTRFPPDYPNDACRYDGIGGAMNSGSLAIGATHARRTCGT